MGLNLKRIGQAIASGGTSEIARVGGEKAGAAFNPIGYAQNKAMTSIYGSDAPVSAGSTQAEADARAAAGEAGARKQAEVYYGTSANLGVDAQDFRDRTKANLNQPSGLANRLIQTSNQDISRANAKAGMAGVDTTAASIRERRNSISKANEMQQTQDAANLANYGKAIGAGISGTEALAAAGAGKAIAGTPTATPDYGGGMFGSIICTELFRQKKLSARELWGCSHFGLTLKDNTYSGYLTIARPIVFLMKKSDKFSNLFIGWARAISLGKPNLFTRIMIPFCFVIGSFKLEVKDARRA